MYGAIGQTAPTLFNMHIGYITLTLKTQAHLHWLKLFLAQSKPAVFSATADQDSTRSIFSNGIIHLPQLTRIA